MRMASQKGRGCWAASHRYPIRRFFRHVPFPVAVEVQQASELRPTPLLGNCTAPQFPMAPLRQISTTLLSRSMPHPSLSQILFLRTMSSKIFVKGLAFSTTEEKLAEAFSKYGSVLKADIVLNKAKNRSKGFGYVTFAKEEEARKAQMAMNRKILHGRVLYVDMQPPNKR